MVPLGSNVTDPAGNAVHRGSRGRALDDHSPVAERGIDRPGAGQSQQHASLQFAVTFTENVTAVAMNDFVLATSGTAAGTLAALTGSGNSYLVTVSNVSGNGTLGLNLADNDGILDQYGHPLGGVGIGNGNFTGQTCTIDHTPPVVVSINRVGAQPDQRLQPAVRRHLQRERHGRQSHGLCRPRDRHGDGAAVLAQRGRPSCVVTVSNVSGTGTLGLNLVDNDSVTDLAGNALGGAGMGNGNFTGQSYTMPPAVVSIIPSGSNPTRATSVPFAVTFNTNVTGCSRRLRPGPVRGHGHDLRGHGSGAAYTVTVSGVSGNGTLGLNLVDNDSILDLFGNPLGGTGAGNGNFTGQTCTIDNTPPTIVSINPAGSTLTGASSVRFVVTFNEPVTGLATADFGLAHVRHLGYDLLDQRQRGRLHRDRQQRRRQRYPRPEPGLMNCREFR